MKNFEFAKILTSSDRNSANSISKRRRLLQASKVEIEEGAALVNPGVQLKYSTHKNIASIASQCGNYQRAMEQYIEVSPANPMCP